MFNAKYVFQPPELDLCSNPDSNPRDQSVLPFGLADEDFHAVIALCQQCKIKIIPCDENWNEKNAFAPDEKIFAKLKITNVTKQLVLVHLGMVRAGFGRDRIQLQFVNINSGYCRGTGTHQCIPIDPGRTYTLLRHFTSGSKPSILCAYNTPQNLEHMLFV